MTEPRWRRRPEGSTWGDYGPDDQLGRLNGLDARKVLQGVAEVREGRTFCLSLPLDLPGGNVLNQRRHPPRLSPTVRTNGRPVTNFRVCEEVDGATDVICDDRVMLYLQYSTQWDSLAHVGGLFDADGDGTRKSFYYNGFRGGLDVTGPTGVDDVEGPSRAHRLGIERLAEHGMQGRGVMIDLRAHCGDARTLVGYDALMRILEVDAVTVEPGDMVCLHTGFADRLLAWAGDPDPDLVHRICAVLDGRDARLLSWITDSGLSALIADNYAVEAYPARPGGACCAILPLHEHCLFKLGLPLGALWHLTPLAEWLRANGRHRFLLTAPPLRLPGAVGSPATPIATV